MKRKNILLFSLTSIGFLLFTQLIVTAQIRKFTEEDKTQIIEAILKKQNFKESEIWDEDEAVNTIYILNENITAQQLPEIKGFKFVLIKPEEVESRKAQGVEYYEFGEFEVKANYVETIFSRTFIHSTARESNGSTMIYKCRKAAGKWTVKGRLDSVYAS